MQSYPLKNLIRYRTFDRYQQGLESRFGAYKFDYQLTYCKPSNNSAMLLDFSYKDLIGRMTVWESGECDLEVTEKETGKSILWKHYQLNDEGAFHQLLADFFLYFRDGKNLPTY
jgi:hypothetical protein